MKKLVELHGSEDWKLIASLLTVRRRPVLTHACTNAHTYTKISHSIRMITNPCSLTYQNRTDVQCQHRWQKVLNPELIKGPWTKEEDQRVRKEPFRKLECPQDLMGHTQNIENQ